MALTATTTKTTREEIRKILGMNKANVIAESPDKPNMKYSVVQNPGPIEVFSPLIEEVKMKRHLTDRTITFCSTYDGIFGKGIYRACW